GAKICHRGLPRCSCVNAAATWLVLKPMDVKEAKKNAPNVHMAPEALTSLKGRGDGYLRDRSSARAKRIQVKPLPSEGPKE
ncbi:hypothetical protein, partial [Propionivibrio sp.]|uniref:hypothetical protein n=1 Tax=Propionivibrio sp. TaxID=2212460 RepID=UPI003BEFED57